MIKYIRNENIIFSDEGDAGFALFNPFTNSFHAINLVGQVIWESLSVWRTLEEITEAVLAAFEVSREQVTDDTHRFLHAMQERQLVVGRENDVW